MRCLDNGAEHGRYMILSAVMFNNIQFGGEVVVVSFHQLVGECGQHHGPMQQAFGAENIEHAMPVMADVPFNTASPSRI